MAKIKVEKKLQELKMIFEFNKKYRWIFNEKDKGDNGGNNKVQG